MRTPRSVDVNSKCCGYFKALFKVLWVLQSTSTDPCWTTNATVTLLKHTTEICQ